MFVICALSYALGQFVYFQIQVHKINQICSPKLGPELWKVATPKLIFHKGLFQPVTECKLENITTIISTNKNIEAIGKALINCTGLITFDLSNNKIKNIPVDLLHNEKFATQFRNLKTFKLNNNPIATELSAGNAGILAIPDIIIRFFTTLTYLDLSNNAITSLPNNLSALKNLNYLNVYNNSINSNGVKLTFAKFCLQNNIKLNLKQNYIYEYVNWSRQNLRNVGVESNINLLKVINFTQVYLNISGLDVSDNNLRNTDFTEVVFPSFSQIKHLNFARNDLYLACTGSIIHGGVIGNMSTMDSQRQFYLDLSKWPNLLYLDLRNNSRLNGFLANDLFAMERRIMEKNATMLISGKLLCLHISIGEATNSNSIFPKILLNQYYNSIQAFEMKLYEEKDVISFDSGIFNIMDDLQYLYIRFLVNTRTTLDPKMFYHKNLLYLKIEGFFNWNSSFNGGNIVNISDQINIINFDGRSKGYGDLESFVDLRQFKLPNNLLEFSLYQLSIVDNKIPENMFNHVDRIKFIQLRNKENIKIPNSWSKLNLNEIDMQVSSCGTGGTCYESDLGTRLFENMTSLRKINIPGNKEFFQGRLDNIKATLQYGNFIDTEVTGPLYPTILNNDKFHTILLPLNITLNEHINATQFALRWKSFKTCLFVTNVNRGETCKLGDAGYASQGYVTTHYYDCILKEDLDETGILRCQVLNNTQAQPTDTRKYNVACYNAFERNEKFRCSASFFKE